MLVELSVVEQRYQAVLEVLQDGLTMTEVAECYGFSRQDPSPLVPALRTERPQRPRRPLPPTQDLRSSDQPRGRDCHRELRRLHCEGMGSRSP